MINTNNIIRNNRKLLTLTIDKQGRLLIKAPINMSEETILDFIRKKQNWIDSKQNMILNARSLHNDILSYSELLYLGTLYKPQFVENIKLVELNGECISIPLNTKIEKVKKLLIKWYKMQAEKVLVNRVEYFLQITNLKCNSVKLINSKCKWGTCDSKRNLAFNWRTVMLPHNIIDYIVVHEITHLVEMNHSGAFWEVIQALIPDYKSHRKLLKDSNYVLELFR
ncbi:MAG: SprT family zinc-dependent metalloprotease [Clostridia bacterium]|jgi:hypothetical protein|nr:M48 family metallopeptidase [Clostridia bacterium]MDD4275698.1 SprT family zinc-dependent metalloprotease [Clostridia bacterium]